VRSLGTRRARRARAALAAVASVALLASIAAMGGGSASAQEAADAALARKLCSDVPRELLVRIQRGARKDRGPQLQLLAEEPNFVDGGLTHAGPWDYVQDVPMFWYGPGWIRSGRYRSPVTLADLAPTQAALLGFEDFHPADGRPLEEALTGSTKAPPRLVVTLIWDSGGMDVLNRWKRSWPTLRSMMDQGAWFEQASAGASPSNTPVSHGTIGTGAFPDEHGFVDEFIYVNGKMQKPNENGPGFLLAPTFADIYDRSLGNAPKVGVVATLSAHVSMMSHGSMWGGGDRDLAITREKEDAATGGAESVTWGMTSDMAPFYRLPEYANEVGGLTEAIERLDREDGRIDDKWRQNDIAQLNDGFDTPARTPYQTELVKAVVGEEGFGADRVPDLLYLNYKAIDTIGHRYSADGVEMSDAVVWQDRDLGELVGFLNDEVGTGKWAMVLTADHGTNRDPDVTGAFRIGIDELTAAIEDRFDDDDGTPLILKLRPTGVWFDEAELEHNGHTVDDVADFVGALTQEDTLKPNLAPAPKPDAKVFRAVFPSRILPMLPCLSEEATG
jgi:type I phosphodiesterase/nucleotide pyrophosphatase